MIPQRIKETCLYVSDLQRTEDFYRGKLGLPVISRVEGRHIFFRAGASVLLCFIAEKTLAETELPPHGARGAIHFAFEVARAAYDAAVQETGSAGIRITHHHTWPNGLRSFYFDDPDGHVVEVIEEGLWER
ncbi:MAG TPA: VOC family protein [Chitinophagaceae bacterium]|jgi:catechol 2,3-dioxygenase-like lactoylglutathione lyase family enzyme|nr:VOC family protein [Chitinophagaceae bacterium]